MKKIKAFTIIEILITMVLSSIVIGAAIYVFLTFNTLLTKTSKRNMQNLEIISLHHILKKDFIEADEIREEYSSLLIQFNDDKKVYYDFEEDCVIRDAIVSRDTFNIKVNDFKLYFLDEQSKLVTEIILDIENEKLDLSIHLVKQYPAVKYLENDTY